MTVTIRDASLQHLRGIYLSLGPFIIFVAGPSVVFSVIWLLRGGNALNANFFLGSALMLAVVAPAFDQLAIGLNADRYEEDAGGTERARIAARLWSWAGGAVGASILLIVIASISSPMSLSGAGWLRLASAVVIGAVPIGLAAASLSFWLSSAKVRRWANGASFVSILGAGLIVPPFMMPTALWQAANILPTRHYAELVWSAGFGWTWPWTSSLWLAGFTGVFLITAMAGARRAQRPSGTTVAPADRLP
jgi:ABC-2 type transport system permease protein